MYHLLRLHQQLVDIDLLLDLVKQHFFCKIEKRGIKKFEVMV
jgi:hypothetical protein